MAVANTKSTVISNNDAVPRVTSSGYLSGAALKISLGTVEVAAADDDASVYRMVRLPSNAVISRIEVLNDAITAGTNYDLGVYDITDNNSGAVVDQDLLATAIDMSVQRALPLDASFEVIGVEKVEKRLWELLGLSADPQKFYDICFTANTVGSAAGTLSMRVIWSQ